MSTIRHKLKQPALVVVRMISYVSTNTLVNAGTFGIWGVTNVGTAKYYLLIVDLRRLLKAGIDSKEDISLQAHAF